MRTLHHPLGSGLALIAAAMLSVVPAAAAQAREAEPALASEQLGGTTLAVVPQIAYERALLRVTGPDGYALTRKFDGAAPINADLLADAEPRTDDDQQSLAEDGESTRVSQSVERRTLPDGRYHYEVVFTGMTGERRVHSGLFYVQGGTTVSRDAMRSQLGSTASELAATRAARTAATAGDYLPDLTIVDGTGVGIGTTAPQGPFHVVGGVRLSNASIPIDSRISIGPTGLWFHDDDNEHVLKLNHTAETNALFVDGAGVGVGTDSPGARLHVLDPAPGPGSHAIIAQEGDLLLQRSGGTAVSFRFGNGARTWNFFNNTGGVFSLRDATGGASPFVLHPGAASNLITLRGGGIGIDHTNPAFPIHHSSGAHLTAGGVWTNASSRSLKTAFEEIDPMAVLAKVTALPVQAWRYKVEEAGAKHIGPAAEDFQRLFGLGNGTSIGTVDASGVALAAIQGLVRKMDEAVAAKDAEIAALQARLEALEQARAPW